MTQQTASTERHGHCLCGAVRLVVKSDKPSMGACHCTMCRRWGGGPSMGLETHEAPRLEGEEHVAIYPSSAWAERAFCKQCGSHLFYRLKSGAFYSLSVGLFDEGGDWPFELQVYVDEKPANYAFANKTKQMTRAEVEALFSSP